MVPESIQEQYAEGEKHPGQDDHPGRDGEVIPPNGQDQPRLGVGAWTPRPRKERPASPMIEVAMK